MAETLNVGWGAGNTYSQASPATPFQAGNGNGVPPVLNQAEVAQTVRDTLAEFRNYLVNQGSPITTLPFRGAALQSLLNGGGVRDLEAECHYPAGGANSIPPDFYRELFDREAIPNRVVQALPQETWQNAPKVYETEDPSELTEWEQAFDDMTASLTSSGNRSWLQTDTGSTFWEYLKRLDILSGIGHFGVLLLGIDDGRNLQDPVEGVEVVVNTSVRSPGGMIHNVRAVMPDAPMHKAAHNYAQKVVAPKPLTPLFGDQTFGGKEDWTQDANWPDALATNCWWDERAPQVHDRYDGGQPNRLTRNYGELTGDEVMVYAEPKGEWQWVSVTAVRNEVTGEERLVVNASVPPKRLVFNQSSVGDSNGASTVPPPPLKIVVNRLTGAVNSRSYPDIQKWMAQYGTVYDGVTQNYSKAGAPPGGPFLQGTDAQYAVGSGMWAGLGMAVPMGASLSGTDQQYFGVQFGPSERLGPPPRFRDDLPSSDNLPKGEDDQQDGQQEEQGQQGEVKRPQLLFLRVFSEDLVQVVRYEWNVRNPRFGLPVMYRVTLNDPRETHSGVGLPLATVYVHWSRIIHLADNLMSSEIFGVPRMRPVVNRLLDLRKIYAADGEGVWKSAFSGLSLETHPQLGGDVVIDQSGTRNMLADFQNGLQRTLVTSGMTVKTIPPQVVDVTPHVAVQLEAVSIQLAMPIRVLKGSERGELASQQDDAKWNDRLKHRQHFHATPRIVVVVVDRLIQIGVLPPPRKKVVQRNDLPVFPQGQGGQAGQQPQAGPMDARQEGAGGKDLDSPQDDDQQDQQGQGGQGGGQQNGQGGGGGIDRGSPMSLNVLNAVDRDSMRQVTALGGASDTEQEREEAARRQPGDNWDAPYTPYGGETQGDTLTSRPGWTPTGAPLRHTDPKTNLDAKRANNQLYPYFAKWHLYRRGYVVNRQRHGRGWLITKIVVCSKLVRNDDGETVPMPQEQQVQVFQADSGYSVEWPELDSNTAKDKAQIAQTLMAAVAQYVQSQAEAILPPEVFFVKVLGWDEETVRDILNQLHAQQAQQQMGMGGPGSDPLTMPGYGERGNPTTEEEPPQQFDADGNPIPGGEGDDDDETNGMADEGGPDGDGGQGQDDNEGGPGSGNAGNGPQLKGGGVGDWNEPESKARLAAQKAKWSGTMNQEDGELDLDEYGLIANARDRDASRSYGLLPGKGRWVTVKEGPAQGRHVYISDDGGLKPGGPSGASVGSQASYFGKGKGNYGKTAEAALKRGAQRRAGRDGGQAQGTGPGVAQEAQNQPGASQSDHGGQDGGQPAGQESAGNVPTPPGGGQPATEQQQAAGGRQGQQEQQNDVNQPPQVTQGAAAEPVTPTPLSAQQMQEGREKPASARVPASQAEVNRRLDRLTNLFRSRGQHQVADWMDQLRQHVNAVGTDEALRSLGEEVKSQEGGVGYRKETQYEGGWENMGDFCEQYLNRHGITPLHQQGRELDPSKTYISSYTPSELRGQANAPDDEGEQPTSSEQRQQWQQQAEEHITRGLGRTGSPADFMPSDPTWGTDKLEEAKHLPGLESSEDLSTIMGKHTDQLTPEVTAKLDERYGKGQWIVKPYGDEAYAGFGIYFPQRAEALKRDAQNTIWSAGEHLANYGFALGRDPNTNKVIGLQHKSGDIYRFGTPQYENTIHGDARYWADKAKDAADNEQGAKLHGRDVEGIGHVAGKYMAQPAFPVVGISEEERAKGVTIKKGVEGRVHIVTKNGKAELVPHSTWLKEEWLPVVFENDHTRKMAQAAVDAINAMPESERQGQVYAPDVVPTADGYKVVEANPSARGGASGYLGNNQFIIDSYVSHLTGREPAHVAFLRKLLTSKNRQGRSSATSNPQPTENRYMDENTSTLALNNLKAWWSGGTYVSNDWQEEHRDERGRWTKEGGTATTAKEKKGHDTHGHGGHGHGHELEHAGHQAHTVHEGHEVAEALAGGHHEAVEAIHHAHEAHDLQHAREVMHGAGHGADAAHGHHFGQMDAYAVLVRHALNPATRAVSKTIGLVPGAKKVGRAIARLHEAATSAAHNAVEALKRRYGEATASAVLGSGSLIHGSVKAAIGVTGPVAHVLPAPHLIGSIPLLAVAEAGKRLGLIGPDSHVERAMAKAGTWVHAIKTAVGRPFHHLLKGIGKGYLAASRGMGKLVGKYHAQLAYIPGHGVPVGNKEEDALIRQLAQRLMQEVWDAYSEHLYANLNDLNAVAGKRAPTSNQFVYCPACGWESPDDEDAGGWASGQGGELDNGKCPKCGSKELRLD